MSKEYTICLAGNPNTGKSTIFNRLTKMKQHTGNWAGKTISNAKGSFSYEDKTFNVVDVPGTYSLFGLSEDEIVARDYICFEENDAIIIVCDASSMVRNLNLVFQTLEYNQKVILVINLMDEAYKNKININKIGLMYHLGLPVVLTSAKNNEGIDRLKETILEVCENKFHFNPIKITYPKLDKIKTEIISKLDGIKNKQMLAMRILDGNDSFFESLKNFYSDDDLKRILNIRKEYTNQEENREYIVSYNFQLSQDICNKDIYYHKDSLEKTKKIDKLITSKLFGIPIMFLLLLVIFFITIKLANYPSEWLFIMFNYLEKQLLSFAKFVGMNNYITEFFIYGIYRTLTQVVAVMLPPMAIFFPMFTFLEDLGYLPRVAYNLDGRFKKCGCHGKQSLTMCMGFGCNAVGVVGTRIIDSPREKLIAIVTNTFVPCNGRFPLIFTLAAIFFSSTSFVANALIPALIASIIVITGIIFTLLISSILSKTLLKGIPSTFTLELPRYRRPNLLYILYNSIINRTVKILARAVLVAAPMGGLIWILSNTYINNSSVITFLGMKLNPFAVLIGLDGIILLAFILAIPANELVLPLIILGYTSGAYIQDAASLTQLSHILYANSWTSLTVICVLLFSLLHWPCSTTLITIYKETKSKLWTFLSFIIPTLTAITICLTINQIFSLIIKLSN